MPRRPAPGTQPPDPTLLILASLADGPKHGYAMVIDIEALAGVRLGPGTLYAALARLEGRGMIEALEASDRRRPYRLTGSGRALLEAQLAAMRELATAGMRRLTAT
jgi:Predicted transcriptional regulators